MNLRGSLIKGITRMPEDNDSAWLLDPHKRGLQNLDRMARYARSESVDLVVVGAGAGGVTLAQRLARAGWRIVILERGPFWDPDRDWVSDEKGAGPIYWTDKRIISGADPVEMGKNNSGVGVGGSMTHFAGYVPRLHPIRLRGPYPRRRGRRLADLLLGSEGVVRTRRARAAGRRPGLAVGRPPHLSPRPAPDVVGRRGRVARRRGVRDQDARRSGVDRQRPLRQPPALHLSRLLPAGLQGQRQGQPADHPPSRRDRARGRGPCRLDGGAGRGRREQRPRGRASPTSATGRSASSRPMPSPSAATRSRPRGCC